jgi:hypothetical protein
VGLAYADDMNLLGDNMEAIRIKRGTLINASREGGP